MLIGWGELHSVHEHVCEAGRAVWNGAFIYRRCREGEQSARQFLQEFVRGEADFSEVLGTYHMALVLDGETVFFADNAGVCRFFVDESAALASDRFLDLLDIRGGLRCDPQSVWEFLSLEYVYGGRTLDTDIKRSDCGLYYRLRAGKITACDKKLPDLSDASACLGLDGYMDRIVDAVRGKKIACVITGGVDSRMVLAHLVKRGVAFDLVVSGGEDMEDVAVARKIAAALNKPLLVVDGRVETEADLENAFRFSDGQRDMAGRYRLTCMWQRLAELGYEICFGGAAGEMYKNSFLNQDFPLYFGKVDRQRFLKMKVITGSLPADVRGPALAAASESALDSAFSAGGEVKKHRACFRMGAQVLQDRYTGANNLWGSVGAIAPLAEPRVQAEVFGVCPYALEMHAFARKQVSRNAPMLAKIKTDRGLNCRSGGLAVLGDMGRNYGRLVQYGLRRVLGRSLKRPRPGESALVLAKKQQALAECIRLGYIRENTDLSRLSYIQQEHLLTLSRLSGLSPDAVTAVE